MSIGRRIGQGIFGSTALAQIIRASFRSGEEGWWHDPSDLTDEKLAWRRNFLLNSELTGAVSGSPGTAPASWSPGGAQAGTLTALSSGFRVNTAAQRLIFSQQTTPKTNTLYRLSTDVDVHASTSTISNLLHVNNTGLGSIVRYEIDGVSVLSTAIPSAGLHTLALIYQTNSTGGAVGIFVGSGCQGNGTADVSFFKVQNTLDSQAGLPYQPITDFNSDFLAAFPDHALFQDSAGTTPVWAIEQPCGLMLDKRLGLVRGAELVDPNFGAGWGAPIAGASVIAGKLTFDGATSMTANPTAIIVDDTVTVVGRWYEIRYTIDADTTRAISVGLSGSSAGTSRTAPGTYRELVLCTVAGAVSVFARGTVGARTGSISSVSVKELPGNHAYQGTAINRPTWSARLNQLTATEDLTSATWQWAGVSKANNAGTAPDGTNTAMLVTENTNNSAHVVYQQFVSQPAGARAGFVWVKSNGRRYISFRVGSPTTPVAVFDTTNGVVTDGSGVTAEDAGSGWWKLTVSHSSAAGNHFFVIEGMSGPLVSSATYAGTAGFGFFLWHPSFVPGDQISFPYQRVNTDTDYDSVGFPRKLVGNGVNRWMQTASIDLTGTDRISLVAGVRCLGAGGQMIAEASALGATVTAGTAWLYRGSTAGAVEDRIAFKARGTINAVGVQSGLLPAPVSLVASGISHLSGDRCELRVDGVSMGVNTQDQGAGSFANEPWYLFARGGNSLFFNGDFYGQIANARPTRLTAAELVAYERFLAQKTGVTLA